MTTVQNRHRSDDELERLLRGTLSAQAQTITTGPELGELAQAHRTRWLRPVLAAASVAVIAGAAALVATSTRGSHHAAPAATHPPTVPSSLLPSTIVTEPATPTSSPAPPASCRVPEPASWRSAIAATRTTVGAQSAFPLAFYGSKVVVVRDFGTVRDLALVDAHGSAVQVYRVPDPNQNIVQSAAVDGHLLVVPVMRQPRGSNGVDPVVVRIDVVDLRTRAVTPVPIPNVDPIGSGPTIDGATIYRGIVYYNVLQKNPSRLSYIHAYNPVTHTDQVVSTSHSATLGEGPTVLARGLFWSQVDDSPAIASTLPPVVASALTTASARQTLVTDGTTYAWAPARHELDWWRPGLAAPRTWQVQGTASPLAVAGPIVMWDDVTGSLGISALDARSGASAPLGQIEPVELAAGGVIAGYEFAGGKENLALIRVDTATLPELHC